LYDEHVPSADVARLLGSERVETIELVFELVHQLGANMAAVSAEHGLTPVQTRALISLREPAPMRDLAAALECDKSNVTGIVDGLERRGLVSRQASPTDRRVKQLVFTSAGRELRDTVLVRLYGEPPAISNLTADEEAELRRLLRRAVRPS
jgi:DNA-binding MarR family transcriptional regulator